jgi:undecaprenyl-diphosphatase
MLWIAKFAIDRARPDFLVGVTAASPSFPSGHATGALAIYGFIAYAVSRSFPSGARRFEIAFWAGVFVLMIGFSRILLHVHYPTDVLGGFLAGTLWLIVGIAVAEWAAQPRSAAPRPPGAGTP